MSRTFELLAAFLLGMLIMAELSNHCASQRVRRTEPERRESKSQVRIQSLRERTAERFVF